MPFANRYLLDTHIFLWSLLEPRRLPEHVALELEDPNNEIWLSPITTWEVLMLAEKGRIELDDTPTLWVEKVLSTLAFKQAPLNHEVALKSRLLSFTHQDPADRFLAASAWVYELTLVTADSNIISGAKGFSVLPAL